MERRIEISEDHFTAVHTSIENVVLDQTPVLRVVKMEESRRFSLSMT